MRRNEIRFTHAALLGEFLRVAAKPERFTRRAWRIFKENPFDARLHSHKIQKLSARYGRKIYATVIEADLRAVFYVEGDMVVTVDIGSHDIYRG